MFIKSASSTQNPLKIALFSSFLLMPGMSKLANAQIQVGHGEAMGDVAMFGGYKGVRSLEKEAFELFKSTKTIFVVPDTDSTEIPTFVQQINAVWNLTSFEVIPFNRLSEYNNKPGYSFATIENMAYVTQTSALSDGSASRPHIYQSGTFYFYELWMIPPKKAHVKKNRLIIARVNLQPDLKTIIAGPNRSARSAANVFFNWGPGYLKGYLSVIQDRLLKEMHFQFTQLQVPKEEKKKIRELSGDTLFIPTYVKMGMYVSNEAAGLVTKKMVEQQEQKMELEEDEKIEIMNKAPFAIKYISAEELDSTIVHANRTIYYMLYWDNFKGKFANIYSSKGALLYANYEYLLAAYKTYKRYVKDAADQARKI